MTYSLLTISACAALLSVAAPEKPAKGIKTPGVGIAFAQLKPEARIAAAAKPDWLFFAESLFVPGGSQLERIDPKANKLEAPVTGLAKPCGGMAVGFGSLWAPLCGDGAIAKIDAKKFTLTAKLPIGASAVPGSIRATPDSIWALVDEKTNLDRIDPEANTVVAEIRLPAGCRSLIFAESALWTACPNENKVLRINPETNLIEKRIEVGAQPEALAAGDGSIWVLCRKEGKLDRVDPKTNAVTKTIDLAVPETGGRMAFGEGSLWVSMPGFPISRIDVKSNTVVQQFHGAGGGVIEVSKGALWLYLEGAVWRIDPKLVQMMIAE